MRPMLTNHHLMDLAERPGPWVTICMPLTGGGPMAKHDPVRYRNLVRAVVDQFAARATDEARRDEILEPLRKLENDREVFNAGAKGLVVFASAEGIEHWHLPTPIDECAVLDERPFLEPLVPIVTDPVHFYVIVMSLHDLRVIECNRFVARELPLPHDTPTRLEQAAGWEVDAPHQRFHSPKPGANVMGNHQPGYHTTGGG